MELLKELVSLLPPEKISQIELVGRDMEQNSKLNKLYFGLLNGNIDTDEEAARELYDQDEESEALTKLKERLKDRLLNTLFFVDINKPKYSSYSNSLITSFQSYAQIKILLTRSARTSAISLAENLMEYTKKYELTEITYLITSDLKNHYGILDLNRNKFNHFNELHQQAEKTLFAESLASGTLGSINLMKEKELMESKSPGAKKILSDLSKLDILYQDIRSYRYLLFYCAAKTRKFEIEKNYTAIIDLAEECLEHINDKPFDSSIAMYTFNRRIFNSYFNLGKIDEAISIAKNSENYTSPHTNNWYIVRYYLCLFLIHFKDYEAAANLEASTFSEKKFKIANPLLKEYWSTISAYLHFLAAANKTTITVTTFRLQKFLNDIPLYQKDKQGRNVAILLVQLLFLLVRNDYGKYIDRMDALNQYRQRYLKENNTYRANCIIRMMVKVGKCGFHPKRVKSYTQKNLWKLKSRPPEISNSAADVEIIPYEHMWEMVMEILEKNYRENY